MSPDVLRPLAMTRRKRDRMRRSWNAQRRILVHPPAGRIINPRWDEIVMCVGGWVYVGSNPEGAPTYWSAVLRERSERRIANARESIALWASARGECDSCETRSYASLYSEYGSSETPLSQRLAAEGWERLTDRAGVIRRCAHHGPLHPWAASLDPVRVVAWLRAQSGEGAFSIDFDDLKAKCT
jgi:hypothetical protein